MKKISEPTKQQSKKFKEAKRIFKKMEVDIRPFVIKRTIKQPSTGGRWQSGTNKTDASKLTPKGSIYTISN